MNILTLKSSSSVLSKQEQLKIKGGSDTSNTESDIIIIDMDEL